MKPLRCDLFTRMIRTRPLMTAAINFLIGCICAYTFGFSGWIYCACIASLLFFACLLRRSRFAAALLILLFLPLGALRFDCAWNALAPLEDQKGAVLSGRICEMPVWNPDTERTSCILDEISIDGARYSGKLRLILRGDTALLQDVQLGQEIRCNAHIWEAETATNPGEFNYSNYLRTKGMRGYATAEIDSAERTEPILHLSDLPTRMRAKLSRHIDALFPRNAAIAKAFLLGDRSELSEDERESYSISGAAHLLAISGMHVSVLAGALNMLLSRFCSRKSAFGITLFALLAYGALIGFSASILRAILMYAVFNAAPIAGRYSDAPTRLASAMLVYLLLRPLAILESGFILSYGASAGILFLYTPLTRLFHVKDYLRSRVGTGLKSMLTRQFPRWIVRSLLVTLAAQIAILPAVVYCFGSQPLWSFLVNLLAIPLAMFAYILAMIAAITSLAPIALAADALFGMLTACVRFFSALPFHSIGIARFPAWLTLCCIIACFCASDLSRLPEKLRRFLPFTVVLAIFISNGCAYVSSRGLSVVFLDVGEADCAVIRCEHSIYLMDTGDAYSPAADYLSAMNYAPEAVFLSHPHADHAGGLDAVLDVAMPKRIYISENWDSYEIDAEITAALNRARSNGVEIISLSAGDSIRLSDKTLLEVLSPTAGFPASAANDDSLVLRLSYGECSVAFTGDAPAKITSDCIGDADLLKVAHHGSNDALSADLLRELSPSVAVISVGYNNYGHPTMDALELLNASGAQVYRTDECGAIICRLYANGEIDVRPYQNAEAGNGLE